MVSESTGTPYNHAMRSPRLVAALASFATLAAAAASCTQDPTVPKLADEPITLSMAFTSTTLQLGTPDTITVTATSLLERPARLYFDSDCQIVLTIRSLAGAVVVPPNNVRTCNERLDSLDIPAAGIVTRRFVWTGTNTVTPPGGASTPLPAGSYFVSSSINALNYTTVAPAVRVELSIP